MATGLAEPSGAVVVGNELLVVESAAHRLTRIPLGASATADEFSTRTQRPPMEIAGGEVTLEVVFTPPPGQKLDDRYGPSTRLLVSSTPGGTAHARARAIRRISARRLVIDERVGDGVLHVAVQAASCDDSAEVEFPACHMHRQDWGVPVRVDRRGRRRGSSWCCPERLLLDVAVVLLDHAVLLLDRRVERVVRDAATPVGDVEGERDPGQAGQASGCSRRRSGRRRPRSPGRRTPGWRPRPSGRSPHRCSCRASSRSHPTLRRYARLGGVIHQRTLVWLRPRSTQR